MFEVLQTAIIPVMLFDIISTRNAKNDNVTKALIRLKRQFATNSITEEEYKQRKAEVLAKIE